ncbi:signal peptidase I [Candidatus Tisiphia endosymbiont of Beris chalybata]|uniref:signal peptidase I n=1 Tax=Candidatus Tisiphia endosymbiont of Beris chalybata TaxID=3066262 RepID=UPI00312C75B2
MNKTNIIPDQNTQIPNLFSLILVILLALLVRTFVMELFFVPSGSMKPTILENDYIFSTKYSYGYSRYSFPFSPNIFSGRIFKADPQRGDIIVFRPPNNMGIRYIKRLIGLPGDKVQIINDLLYVNGKAVERTASGIYTSESGKVYKKFKETLPNGVSYITYQLQKFPEAVVTEDSSFEVPEGKYFFLGDNRDESRDSRMDLGYVPFENCIAKARFIIFSTQEKLWKDEVPLIDQIFDIKTWMRVVPWITSIRLNRLFKPLSGASQMAARTDSLK